MRDVNHIMGSALLYKNVSLSPLKDGEYVYDRYAVKTTWYEGASGHSVNFNSDGTKDGDDPYNIFPNGYPYVYPYYATFTSYTFDANTGNFNLVSNGNYGFNRMPPARQTASTSGNAVYFIIYSSQPSYTSGQIIQARSFFSIDTYYQVSRPYYCYYKRFYSYSTTNKGAYKDTILTTTSYPINGVSGSYWYVKR